MTRSVEETLQHGEDLVDRFEDYEPNDADELDPTAVAMLREAVQARSSAGCRVLEAVRRARHSGMTWSAIAVFIGISGEAARQRYADKVS